MAPGNHANLNPTATPFVPGSRIPSYGPTYVYSLSQDTASPAPFPTATEWHTSNNSPSGHNHSTTTFPQTLDNRPDLHSSNTRNIPRQRARTFSDPTQPSYLQALSTAVKERTSGLFQHERDEYITKWMRIYHQSEYFRSEGCHLAVKERLERLVELEERLEEMEAEIAGLREKRVRALQWHVQGSETKGRKSGISRRARRATMP